MAALVMVLYAVCVAAAVFGGAVAFGASNAVKRLAGLAIAHLSAALLLSLLGTPALALGLLAALAAEIALGAALCTRIVEEYGVVETDVLGPADFADEERE
jgi:hypothetical protein